MNFFLIFLINSLLLDCVNPINSIRIQNFKLFKNRFKSERRPIKERINDKFIRNFNPNRLDQLEARLFLDFIADPSIFVTMLNSLEQMYLTLPFGWLLKPIVNFFRIPNRRRKRSSLTLNKLIE